ncbi:Hypp6968 [Branchiostoma lanceolatum]|uniref:Hypp6968 protein n=1 Tax=Branchiostoma lanceolatum TaxID=7740 RepID=A0A8K0E7X2_BRALA|nr:Hypp6968 [Branchiostoma lanceolatum]
MASNSTEHVGSVAKYVSIKVKKGGNVVVDWYALNVGQGELTLVQLYERLVAASELWPYNFKQVLSRSATVHFFCNDEKIGRGIEVYSGLQVGQATKQFGCFIHMEVDKTAAPTEAPRAKSVFEV